MQIVYSSHFCYSHTFEERLVFFDAGTHWQSRLTVTIAALLECCRSRSRTLPMRLLYVQHLPGEYYPKNGRVGYLRHNGTDGTPTAPRSFSFRYGSTLIDSSMGRLGKSGVRYCVRDMNNFFCSANTYSLLPGGHTYAHQLHIAI